MLNLSQEKEEENYLVSEPNYHTTKFFTENLLARERKKTETLLNKILMYEFSNDYVKPKYNEKAKLCYIDTDSFIIYIKTDDIYIFTKMLQKMLKLDLILHIMNQNAFH